MKCKRSKLFLLSWAALLLLFSATYLPAEVCYSDEADQEQRQIFNELATNNEQLLTRVSELETSLTESTQATKEAQKQQAISEASQKEAQNSLDAAKKSWRAESIKIAISGGLVGFGIGAVIVIILEAIFNKSDVTIQAAIAADQ